MAFAAVVARMTILSETLFMTEEGLFFHRHKAKQLHVLPPPPPHPHLFTWAHPMLLLAKLKPGVSELAMVWPSC